MPVLFFYILYNTTFLFLELVKFSHNCSGAIYVYRCIQSFPIPLSNV